MSSTIKDVAKEANVSTATVSRLLNGTAFVELEAKSRILEAIRKLNYYPNSVAKNLKNGATYTIAFVVSDLSNEYYISMARSIENTLHPSKYSLILYSSYGEESRERNILQSLMNNKVDGLILNTTGKNDDTIIEISKRIPTILVSRKLTKSGYKGGFVDTCNTQGMITLTSHLIALGHRRIGIINGRMDINTGYERFAGFKNAMEAVNIPVGSDYEYRFDGDFTEETGYLGASVLMNKVKPPTAIVIANNAMTLGALKFMRFHRVRIPDEVTISCFGSINNIELLFVKPNIVTMDARVIGEQIGAQILGRLTNNKFDEVPIIYEPKMVEGDFSRITSV